MDASMVKRLKELEDEILEAHWFPSLEEVRQLTHQWIEIYNHDRPHEACGNPSPRHFLLKYGTVGNAFPAFQQDPFYQFSLFSTESDCSGVGNLTYTRWMIGSFRNIQNMIIAPDFVFDQPTDMLAKLKSA